jgi:transposase-like protein
VAESFEEGANISEVARRNGVARGLLTVWRHKLAAEAGVTGSGFAPVRIEAESAPATTDEPGAVAPAQTRALETASRPAEPRGAIEIEVSGARVRVEPGVDPATLSPCCRRSETSCDCAAARPQSRDGGTAGRLSQIGAHVVGAGERSAARQSLLRRCLRFPIQTCPTIDILHTVFVLRRSPTVGTRCSGGSCRYHRFVAARN